MPVAVSWPVDENPATLCRPHNRPAPLLSITSAAGSMTVTPCGRPEHGLSRQIKRTQTIYHCLGLLPVHRKFCAPPLPVNQLPLQFIPLVRGSQQRSFRQQQQPRLQRQPRNIQCSKKFTLSHLLKGQQRAVEGGALRKSEVVGGGDQLVRGRSLHKQGN